MDGDFRFRALNGHQNCGSRLPLVTPFQTFHRLLSRKLIQLTLQASRLTADSRQTGPDDSEGQDARPEGLQAAQGVMTAPPAVPAAIPAPKSRCFDFPEFFSPTPGRVPHEHRGHLLHRHPNT